MSKKFQDHANTQNAARQKLSTELQQKISSAHINYANTKRTNKSKMSADIKNLTAGYMSKKAALEKQYFPRSQDLIDQKKQLTDQFQTSLSKTLQDHADAQDLARKQMDVAIATSPSSPK